MCLLSGNQMNKSVLQPIGRKGKPVPAPRFRIAREHVKHRRRILPDHLRTGEIADIRVKLRRGIIVVARSEMDIAADAVLLSSHNKCYFTVGLKPDQSVNDMAACLFQLSRPDNVIFLVKPRL